MNDAGDLRNCLLVLSPGEQIPELYWKEVLIMSI